MRKFIKLVVAALLLGIGSTDAVAVDHALDWPPAYQSDVKPLGMHIQDDFSFGMTNRLSKAIIPGPQPYCTSLDDPACTSRNENWWIIRLLPQCADTTVEDDCVEGLEVTQGGDTRKATLIEKVQDRTWIADAVRGLPIAGTQGLWSDPFSSDSSRKYFVNVFGDLNAVDGKNPPFRLVNFFASITATSEASTLSGNCIWNKSLRCGRRVGMDDDVRFALVLHLSPQLTGWLGGRLNNPSIQVETLNNKVDRLTVAGEAMNVNMVGATVPYSSAPADLLTYMRKTNPGCPVDQCNVGIESSGPHTFDYLEKWKPFTKDSASRTIPYWSISSRGNSINPSCNKSGGFVGLVTTNATAYQREMPALDGSEISYKVAGTHFMSDGMTLTKGSYNLLLRSDVARCVYGFSSAPIKASVSIVSDSDVQSVATEVVNEKNGWLYLAANGFHFSQPSIKIQLSQESSQLPAPEVTTQAAPKAPSKKITITCAKGKLKKKITAAKPACPTGYKKVA